MTRAHGLLRAARFLVILAAVVTAALFLRRYERMSIPATDQSMDPTYPGGSNLVVESLGPDDPLPRGADVVYSVESEGIRYARFGRVRALPGDVVGEEDGLLTVNGSRVEPLAIPGRAMGTVPEGAVLILALNPAETRYLDSRGLGFIPRDRVVALIRARLW